MPHRILNSLGKDREQTSLFMDTIWICYCWAMRGTPGIPTFSSHQAGIFMETNSPVHAYVSILSQWNSPFPQKCQVCLIRLLSCQFPPSDISEKLKGVFENLKANISCVTLLSIKCKFPIKSNKAYFLKLPSMVYARNLEVQWCKSTQAGGLQSVLEKCLAIGQEKESRKEISILSIFCTREEIDINFHSGLHWLNASYFSVPKKKEREVKRRREKKERREDREERWQDWVLLFVLHSVPTIPNWMF